MKKAIMFTVIALLLAFPMLSHGGPIEPCSGSDPGPGGVLIASDKDQPCYAGGQYVGNCSRNQPYYNVFSGSCYATLDACKKADGDLSRTSGSGGCVRCGK